VFDQTIRRLLSMFPKGATNDQLIWRLSATGVRVSPSELLAGLGSLAQRGEIFRDPYGRWQVPRPPATSSLPTNEGAPSHPSGSSSVLTAVEASCFWSSENAEAVAELELDAAASLPDWASLLGYYAATQRKDPRGQIEAFPDRHGSVWQLFRTIGAWWSGASLRISMEQLPPTFVESLSKRKISSAAIGWPVSLFPSSQGNALLPGLILPVNFRIDGSDLIIEIESPEPTLNPAWSREVCRHTSWSATELLERLCPEGESNTIGEISDRMRHCLATIGGQALRPADLAREVSLTGKGLRNVAALFLSEDGSFTKATAEDLEAIREWPTEVRVNTALAKLLTAEIYGGADADTLSILPTGSQEGLTDNQFEAAEMALRGPLTVIQGPPGSGKSQVILALMISAVVAGKSVLFSARNHQAVTEVERRLKELVPDAPLMTRARDAEGERDISFLDALKQISYDKSAEVDGAKDLEDAKRSILRKAESHQTARRTERKQTEVHLALSALSEQRDLLSKHVTDTTPQFRPLNWLRRLLNLLRLHRSREKDLLQPLPETASIAEIDARIAKLRSIVDEFVQSPPNSGLPSDEEQAALRNDLVTFLPKLAKAITQPSENERQTISARVKELEFSNVRRARQLTAEDARTIIQHRPIWAVTTLSVPARIPLVAALFDYVIFDEASQSDIASALPLLARSSKAIVVGDPMQLTFVRPLGTATEHALMDAAGFPEFGRSTFAQSVNSLFDFFDHQPAARRGLLADQFRSAPAIVDYLNADFYNGILINRRPDEYFKPPDGYRPGLAWEDVAGSITVRDGGTVNIAEAEHIAILLKRFAEDSGFTGSVGVISPLNAQVAEIQKAANAHLNKSQMNRLGLRIATVDKFQGSEADVIIFSLVLAANAPFSTRSFLQKERRRFNVAVSRARALCIIVGDLTYAMSCRIRHIEFLAERASRPWSPPKPNLFDSSWERRLDTAMRSRGLQPFPQYPVGRRYLDFALDPNGIKLNVEVDGRRWHVDASGNRKTSDRLRDKEMHARGWKVLRFWVHQLEKDMEACLDSIERELGR
jgi:very-short-patch-repair endonuclease